MNKAKRQAKHDEESEKLLDEVLSGRVKIAKQERKKKKAQPNRKGGITAGEEAAEEMLNDYSRLLRILLPGILVKLSRIADPREPGKITYSLPFLLLFGILIFLSHCTSRRAANKELAQKSIMGLAEEFVPGITDMPHADTLARVLERIDVENIDRFYEEMLKEFVRSDTFKKLNPGRFHVAIDGTQKFGRAYEWDKRALSRNADDEEKQYYYAYVLESVLILNNGMVLPLLTEFLENKDDACETGEESGVDLNAHAEGCQPGEVKGEKKPTEPIGQEQRKQDCETKGFHRMAERLAKLLGKGCVTLVLDGIYASGPVISRCNEYGWEYMIVLKRDCIKTVWQDFGGLRKIEPEHTHLTLWGNRMQEYQWSNGLEYTYGRNHKSLKLNLVTCVETWKEGRPRSGGKPKVKRTEYAWLSSCPLRTDNVFELCTVVARSRWRIENNFLVEKHQGYNYSHCFSYTWDAMKGFHYLMKFGFFVNVLVAYSETMSIDVRAEGIRHFVKKIWENLRQGKWPAEQNGGTRSPSTNSNGHKKMRFPKLKEAS